MEDQVVSEKDCWQQVAAYRALEIHVIVPQSFPKSKAAIVHYELIMSYF